MTERCGAIDPKVCAEYFLNHGGRGLAFVMLGVSRTWEKYLPARVVGNKFYKLAIRYRRNQVRPHRSPILV